MALTSSQHKALFEALLATYDANSLDQLFSFSLGRDLEEIVSLNQNKTNILFAVLKSAIKGGWLGELLRAVAEDEDVADKAELQALLVELRAATNLQSTFAAHVDPFEACFLRMGGQLPFVDRGELRQFAASMTQTNGHKVLLVDGPPRSGKTYTREFIEHLSNRLESYEFHYIDFEEEYFPGFHPGDFMTGIALRMSVNPNLIPAKDAQSARWIRNLATWLAGESAKRFDSSGRMLWIVIDSIRKVELSTEMRDLIKRLVSQAEFGAKSVRVVLLDSGGPGELPPNLQDRVAVEKIVDPPRAELSAFLQSSSAQSGTQFDGDALEALVDWVLEKASTPADSENKRSFIERLADAVEEAYQLFLTGENVEADSPAIPVAVTP